MRLSEPLNEPLSLLRYLIYVREDFVPSEKPKGKKEETEAAEPRIIHVSLFDSQVSFFISYSPSITTCPFTSVTIIAS